MGSKSTGTLPSRLCKTLRTTGIRLPLTFKVVKFGKDELIPFTISGIGWRARSMKFRVMLVLPPEIVSLQWRLSALGPAHEEKCARMMSCGRSVQPDPSTSQRSEPLLCTRRPSPPHRSPIQVVWQQHIRAGNCSRWGSVCLYMPHITGQRAGRPSGSQTSRRGC